MKNRQNLILKYLQRNDCNKSPCSPPLTPPPSASVHRTSSRTLSVVRTISTVAFRASALPPSLLLRFLLRVLHLEMNFCRQYDALASDFLKECYNCGLMGCDYGTLLGSSDRLSTCPCGFLLLPCFFSVMETKRSQIWSKIYGIALSYLQFINLGQKIYRQYYKQYWFAPLSYKQDWFAPLFHFQNLLGICYVQTNYKEV